MHFTELNETGLLCGPENLVNGNLPRGVEYPNVSYRGAVTPGLARASASGAEVGTGPRSVCNYLNPLIRRIPNSSSGSPLEDRQLDALQGMPKKKFEVQKSC